MEEKRYLKWYNKVGYGSGDIAGNVVYAFLTAFVMIYLTDTIGLNSGIVGTLIAVSKIFDGVSDIFFGSMIDRTKSKWVKQDHGCFTGSLDVHLHYLEYLQFQQIWERQHSMHGSLSLTHY